MGNIAILLRSHDRPLVLDHGGSGKGKVFPRFLLRRGVGIKDWLFATKFIHLNTIGHRLSVPWRPIFGIIVAKCSRRLKERH